MMKFLKPLIPFLVIIMVSLDTSSCEKSTKGCVSEKYVGEWEGMVYSFIEIPDKSLLMYKVIELDIDSDATYICTLFDFRAPGGIPYKYGEGFSSQGYVIEGNSFMTLSNSFNQEAFSIMSSQNGFILESADYLIDLHRK